MPDGQFDISGLYYLPNLHKNDLLINGSSSCSFVRGQARKPCFYKSK